MEGALVCLVDYQAGITCKVGLSQKLSQKHTVRHVLNNGFFARAILKTNRVTNLVPHPDSHLRRYSRSHGHGSHSPRLSAADLTELGIAYLVEILRDLSSLARPCFCNHNQDLMVFDRRQEILAIGKDREVLADLSQLFQLCKGGQDQGITLLLDRFGTRL